MHSVSWFDIFTAFFLTASAIWSYHRGFVKEAISLFAIVAGFWVASTYYTQAVPLFRTALSEKVLADAAAFVTLFVLTAFFVSIIGTLGRRLLRATPGLSFADKVTGAAVGVGKGVLILAVVTYPLALIPGLKDDLVKDSVAAPILTAISKMALDKFAPDLSQDLDRAAKKTLEMKDRVKKLGESVKEPLRARELLEQREKDQPKAPKTPVTAQEPEVKESAPAPVKESMLEKEAEKEAGKEAAKEEKPAKSAQPKKPAPSEKDTLSDSDRKELDQLLNKLEKARAK